MIAFLMILVVLLLVGLTYEVYLVRKTIIAASDLNLESQEKTRFKMDDMNRQIEQSRSRY